MGNMTTRPRIIGTIPHTTSNNRSSNLYRCLPSFVSLAYFLDSGPMTANMMTEMAPAAMMT